MYTLSLTCTQKNFGASPLLNSNRNLNARSGGRMLQASGMKFYKLHLFFSLIQNRFFTFLKFAIFGFEINLSPMFQK